MRFINKIELAKSERTQMLQISFRVRRLQPTLDLIQCVGKATGVDNFSTLNIFYCHPIDVFVIFIFILG